MGPEAGWVLRRLVGERHPRLGGRVRGRKVPGRRGVDVEEKRVTRGVVAPVVRQLASEQQRRSS